MVEEIFLTFLPNTKFGGRVGDDMNLETQDATAHEPLIKRELSAVQRWFHGFRTFVQRGNVVDLAVGVMIGAAFGKIVTSFVTDIITPPLGLAMGKVKFSELKWHLGGPPDAPVTINYGIFIQNLVDFLLVAFALFLLISVINRLHRKPPPPKAELSVDQKLLTEIRDELRRKTAAG